MDEYGFQRPKGFNYIAYDKFMSEYVTVLVRRAKRWEQLLGKNTDASKPESWKKLKRSSKLERFVHKGQIMSEFIYEIKTFQKYHQKFLPLKVFRLGACDLF